MTSDGRPTPRAGAPAIAPEQLLAAVAERVAADPVLAPWVAADQGEHLADLCTWAVGAGPAPEPDPGMDHARFSLLASHVADVLEGLRVEDAPAADVLDRLTGSRADVVTGPIPLDLA